MLADLDRAPEPPGHADGEEPDSGPATGVAETMAKRVLKSMCAPVTIGDHEAAVSASIGVSILPLDASNARDLLKNADTAMARQQKIPPRVATNSIGLRARARG